MKRNTRLGLVLTAVFMMSAFVATAAQGKQAGFTASSYPAVTTWHSEEESTYVQFPGAIAECDVMTYESTLSEASTQLTLTPHYAGCNISFAGNITFRWNGCHYLLEAGTAISTEEATASTFLKCPPDKKAEVVMYSELCIIDIPEQQMGEITFTNKEGSGEEPQDYVTADMGSVDFEYTMTRISPFFSPCSHNTGEGNLVGSFVARGYDDLSNHWDTETPETKTYTHGEKIDFDVKST
ncbi:MAG TPA: hypothetical protein VNT92_10720 [Acidimicrobiia bacterium]|nr:hypothetical protein [Acidimicrobiia bacterium]